MTIEEEVAQLVIRIERLERQVAEIRSWSANTEQDVDFDREQLANARRDIEFTSAKVEERLTTLETGVATIYGFYESLAKAIAESRQINSLEPLLNVETLSLPASLDAEDRD